MSSNPEQSSLLHNRSGGESLLPEELVSPPSPEPTQTIENDDALTEAGIRSVKVVLARMKRVDVLSVRLGLSEVSDAFKQKDTAQNAREGVAKWLQDADDWITDHDSDEGEFPNEADARIFTDFVQKIDGEQICPNATMGNLLETLTQIVEDEIASRYSPNNTQTGRLEPTRLTDEQLRTFARSLGVPA